VSGRACVLRAAEDSVRPPALGWRFCAAPQLHR